MNGMPHLPTVTWDEQDRLRSTTRQIVTSGTPETTYYDYDAVGQRLRKVTDRQAQANQSATRSTERLYFGALEIYREFGGDGVTVKLQRETFHIQAWPDQVALVETRTLGTDPAPAQLVRYQHTNHLGSAMLELDDHADIISYEEYFPYGSSSYQAVRNKTETPKRYRYTGKERDEESDLYYHGARYYAPWLGRWTACDPMEMVDGTNMYTYVRCRPVVLQDASGRASSPAQIVIDESKLRDRHLLGGVSIEAYDEVQKLAKSTQLELSATIRALKHASEDAPTMGPAGPFHESTLSVVVKLAADLPPEQFKRVLKEFAKIPPPRDEIVPAGRIPVSDRIPPTEDLLTRVNRYGEEIPTGQKLKTGERAFELQSPALGAYHQLRDAARQAGFSKETFALTSAFRSQKKQDSLKAKSVAKYNDAAESSKWTASLSEHITGLTFDLQVRPGISNDAGNIDVLKASPEYQWLHQNAPEFGLNEFLPTGKAPGEPWHFSYNVVRIHPQIQTRAQTVETRHDHIY